MLLSRTTLASLALLVPIIQARTSVSLCVTVPTFTSCYHSVLATNCATAGDGGPYTACACSTASAIFSCYTSACTSDSYYSSYYAAISICQAAGLGGPPGAGPTPTGAGAGTTGTGPGATATGAGAGATAAATGANRNAAGPARPVGWVAGDAWAVMTGLGLWIGGLGVVLL